MGKKQTTLVPGSLPEQFHLSESELFIIGTIIARSIDLFLNYQNIQGSVSVARTYLTLMWNAGIKSVM